MEQGSAHEEFIRNFLFFLENFHRKQILTRSSLTLLKSYSKISIWRTRQYCAETLVQTVYMVSQKKLCDCFGRIVSRARMNSFHLKPTYMQFRNKQSSLHSLLRKLGKMYQRCAPAE